MRTQLQRARMHMEALDERSVPSATAPDVDLTAHGAIGTINSAIFRQFDAQPTGTGFIDSFVRVQAKGAGAQVQQGYNTDARPLQFDENKSPQFTRSLRLSDVPEVNIGGVLYREFLLDINQKASQPLLSLDSLRLFVGNSGNLTGYNPVTNQLAGLTAVFDMDAGGDHFVLLNARLNQGSGKGDMLLYIPSAAFAGAAADAFLYLYSRFGDHLTGNAGFEEWAVSANPLTCNHGTISGTITNSSLGGTGVPDVVVFLDANGNGMLDENEVYTVTDANGRYEFVDLAAGLGAFSTYTVRVIPPDGFTQESPNPDPITLLDCEDHRIVDFVFSGAPNS